MIYETVGKFAGKPKSVLPRSYQIVRPITSGELAERIKMLAWVCEQNGGYKRIRSTPMNEVVRNGYGGIAEALRVDLHKLIQANSDLFLLSGSEILNMTYIEFADLLRLAASKLEAMK